MDIIANQQFGYLTALYRDKDHVSKSGKKYEKWVCRCDCGQIKSVLKYQLTSGDTVSCGCYNQKIHSKTNRYEFKDEYVIGYTEKNEPFYFDIEDYDKIKDYYWGIMQSGYVRTRGSTELILMHRLIMDCPADMMVDHIGGYQTKNDNRKANLRIVTRQQNAMNSKLSTTNTSGHKGVRWNERRNKWIARITINGKDIYLGSFTNLEDAIAVRKEAERKYYGEYSYDTSQELISKNKRKRG